MNFFKNKELLQNCSWLYLVHLANYIFPILVIPYLMRILGAEKYGLIAMSQALMLYLNVVVEYGFNLTSVRDITNHRNDIKTCKKIFNDVMICKIYLLTVCFICVYSTVHFVPVESEIRYLIFVSFFFVIASAFFPIWFFQGMEDMKQIAISNLCSRLLYLILVLVLIREAEDYIWVIFFQGIGAFVAGIFSLHFIYRKYGIFMYCIPHWRESKKVLLEGRPIFIANICGNIYSQGAVILTGIFAGSVATAYYSLGQKISGTVVGLVQPFVQASYPYICKLFKDNKKNFMKFFHKTIKIAMCLSIVMAVLIFFSATHIAYFLQGNIDAQLVEIIRMFILVTIGTTFNVLLHPFILAMGKYNFVQGVYLRISIIFVCLALFSVNYFGVEGTIFSLIIVEYYIMMQYLKVCFKEM